MIALRILAIAAGALLVWITVLSAVRTLVLPRADPVLISRAVFLAVRYVLGWIAPSRATFERRDALLAFHAPLSLLLLPVAWLGLITGASTLVLWGLGTGSISDAFVISGSSELTLGYLRPDGVVATAFTFLDAALGLALVALLISYLPTVYSAFSRREIAVALLEPMAGTPPSAQTLLVRYQVISGIGELEPLWRRWREWFADLEESHTSLAALVFFRSPQPYRSWVTAAGCVLDSASLTTACFQERSAEAQLCIRGGFVALRHIADFFAIPYDPDPRPDDPISITREEFDEVWEALREAGAALKPDPDEAWRAFAGWRVNYDVVLRSLASLVQAPPAPWSTDRALPFHRPPLRYRPPLPRRFH